MTVFNTFLTIFRRNLKSLLIYLVVFVVFGNMSAKANADTMKKSFEEITLKVSIIDNDNSELSKALINYIGSEDEIKNLKTKDLKKINDYVRYGLVDYAVIIPKGYQKNIDNGNLEIKYISGGTTTCEAIMTRKINTFLNDVKAYKKSKSTLNESIEKAKTAAGMADDSDVSIISSAVKQGKDYLYYIFNFAAYGLYMVLCLAISIGLVAIKEENVQNRMAISPYSFLRKNIEIILGILVLSLIIVAQFILLSVIYGIKSPEINKIGFYIFNILITMLPGISIGFAISSISNDENIINLISNCINLTMAFISGVFVSKEILSDGVQKVARFFPMYWYVEGNEVINNNPVKNILGSDFIVCVIMQLLFAVLIFTTGLTINKIRERA